MRLWHKDLVSVLPRKQLLAQWRECCAIVGKIQKRGTPNQPLVNPVMQYTKSHFYTYCCLVAHEMITRGYSISEKSRLKIYNYVSDDERQISSRIEKDDTLFNGWHNERYLIQCFYNLQEKYDRGVLTEDEMNLISKRMEELNVKIK